MSHSSPCHSPHTPPWPLFSLRSSLSRERLPGTPQRRLRWRRFTLGLLYPSGNATLNAGRTSGLCSKGEGTEGGEEVRGERGERWLALGRVLAHEVEQAVQVKRLG